MYISICLKKLFLCCYGLPPSPYSPPPTPTYLFEGKTRDHRTLSEYKEIVSVLLLVLDI